LIKRALSKQAIEYNRLLAKKDEEIQQLNSRIKQFSKVKRDEIKIYYDHKSVYLGKFS